jgi:hypothetical protein
MTEEESIIFRKKFARWLDEWELEQEFRIDDINVGSNEKAHQIPFKEPIYTNIKAGDILLLSNELTSKKAGLTKPLFIAILRLWEKKDNNEFYLWAPYSPFTQPATDKEIKFENSDSRLSVLSLWNTHTSPKDLLSKSWFIGELEEKNRRDALKVFWYSLGMEELPQELENKVGPKLFNSKDPRRKYLKEELSKTSVLREHSMGTLVNSPAVGSDGGDIIQFPPPAIFDQSKDKLAAAEDTKESVYQEYQCHELPIKVTLQYIPRHEQIVIELTTEDENLKGVIDQFKIKLTDDDKPNLTFENGECVHPISLKSVKFSLISPDGKTLSLSRTESS